MKILEVRDGFIKFEADKSIYLSSFIQIDGETKSYIAQVNQIKNLGSVYMASAKILFLLINGELYNYDRTLPSIDSDIKTFTKDILNNSINAKKPVIIGKTLDNSLNINIDSSAFNKKMLISIDSQDLNNILIRNFTKQFEHLGQNSVIIDTLGIIKAKKFVAGKDFKLPLNKKTLNFLYESCLNDATADSKAIIVDIFNELALYSETVPFVPFETLKSIVAEMVDKQHIFKLLILKNKLAKFEKLGYFASTKNETDNLDNILTSKCAVIDLSSIDTVFQNKYLDYIYEKLENIKNVQVFLETSNTVSKKNLKKILTESELPTTIVTHSKFIYLNDIKNLFDNFIIEPGITNNEIFSVYSSFLTSMHKNTYLTTGEAINYIPLVSQAQLIDDVTLCTDVIPNEIEEEILNEKVSSSQTLKGEVREEIEDEISKESSENIADETQEELLESLYTENSDNESDNKEYKCVDDDFQEYDEYYDENVNDNDTEIIDITENDDSENENITVAEDIRLTNEEAYAVVEEKAGNILAAVAESLEETAGLNVFAEGSEENSQDGNQDILEENDIIQEDFAGIDSEQIENVDISEDTNENNDEQTIIEPSYNDTAEYKDNSFTQELEHETTVDDDLSELNCDNEVIGEIADDEILQNDDESLEEISSFDYEDSQQEFESTTDDEEDITEGSISEEMLDSESIAEENSEELELEEEPEEISVEPEDMEMLLEETVDEEKTEQLPHSNIEIDLSEPSVMPIAGEALNHDFDEIVELDPSESSDEDIIVDLNEDSEINELDENIEQQIIEDVDKVYTTMKNENITEEISDSDLDLIDQLNNDDEQLEDYSGEELKEGSDIQDGIINEIHEDVQKQNSNDSGEILEKRDSNTPIVPVYDADIPQEDMVMSDPIQQGDAVMHVKYGNGVVEKMIKYGNKTLFAINFENIGRRLLDPTLTEIKRV